MLVSIVERARQREPVIAASLEAAIQRAVAVGVPPMFTFRTALQMLPEPRSEAVDRYLAVADESGRLLWEVIEYGWPGRRKVGPAGAFAAAALLAHADHDARLRGAALAAMKVAVKRGEADPRHYAHIVDRTRAFEGKPTLYATFGVGQLGSWPMEAPEAVDVRRREIGLPDLQADLRRFANGAKPGPFLAPFGLWQWMQLGFVMTLGKISLLGAGR